MSIPLRPLSKHSTRDAESGDFMKMVREIPSLEGIPPSPTNIKHLKRRREYGTTAKVPFPNNIAVLILEFYQRKTTHWPHVCNHIPSCSEYARVAFMIYGFPTALFLSFEHIKECSDPMSNWPKEIKP